RPRLVPLPPVAAGAQPRLDAAAHRPRRRPDQPAAVLQPARPCPRPPERMRADMSRAILRLCAALLSLSLAGMAQAACEVDWPHWQRFAERWIQPDGRLLESSLEKNHSTSEGQSYALFFA